MFLESHIVLDCNKVWYADSNGTQGKKMYSFHFISF